MVIQGDHQSLTQLSCGKSSTIPWYISTKDASVHLSECKALFQASTQPEFNGFILGITTTAGVRKRSVVLPNQKRCSFASASLQNMVGHCNVLCAL